jgi:hypothetical protein
VIKFFGFLALALVAAVGLVMSWLVWPLPSTAFDWQVIAEGFVQEGDCSGAAIAVTQAAWMAPDEAEEFIAARQADGLCGEVFDPGSPSNILESVSLLSSNSTARSFGPPAPWAERFSSSVQSWLAIRQTRQAAGEGPLAWTDLKMVFRCDLAFSNERELLFYLARPTFAELSDENMNVPAWEARRTACNTLVAHELTRLQGQGRAGAASEARARLQSVYRERVEGPY